MRPPAPARFRHPRRPLAAGLTGGLLLLLLAAAPAGLARAQSPPPPSPSPYLSAPVPAIDTTDRQQVVDAYNRYLVTARQVKSGWTGNLAADDPGTVSDAFQVATLQTVNYYRAMAGLPNRILDPAYTSDCQQGALMLSVNGYDTYQLKGDPHIATPSWKDYTDGGALALKNSSLAGDSAGPQAVDQLMVDSGPNNKPVGHRLTILIPTLSTIAHGSVTDPNGTTDVLWTGRVPGDNATATQTSRDGFIAWPSQGFFPVDLVPTRWSFAPLVPGSAPDVTQAVVTVSINGGQSFSPTVISRSRIQVVFVVPRVLFPPGNDSSGVVTISHYTLNGQEQSLTYTVRLIPTPGSGGETNPGGILPTVSIAADPATGAVTVARRASDDLSADLRVAYAVGGSARAGTDYAPLSGQKVIKAGQTSASVHVRALAGADPARSLKLRLTAKPARYQIDPAAATARDPLASLSGQ